jgi:thioesterase domain-containing protein
MLAGSIARKLTTAKWRFARAVDRGRGQWRGRFLEEINAIAVWSARLQPVRCDAVLLKGKLHAWAHPDMHDGWKTLVQGNLEVRSVDGLHSELMQEPYVKQLAAELKDCLVRAYARHVE